jgi:hypothetical protein
MATDLAALVLDKLHADATFLSLVTGGADNVLLTGDMLMTVLHDAEETRRSEDTTNVLGVSVQDAGSVRFQGPLWRSTVIVRALDRLNGYDAIREVRERAIAVLEHTTGILDEGAVLSLNFAARTGHRVDAIYAVDFEAVTFTAIVERKPIGG